ncbi:Receptor-like protein [Arachis hypogaea]|nr:Receptor-like protein [Arachis hypogaea]
MQRESDDQRSLLLQFKNNFTFDHQYSTKLKTWNQSIACCDWSGVSCDHDAHVIALDLSETIQAALSVSNISRVYFNSSVPSKFNKLENLTYLNLSHAGFVGQFHFPFLLIQGTVSNWIWRLDSLDYLDITHNFLTNFEGPLQNRTHNLYSLYLQFNKLQEQIPGFLHYASFVDYSSNNFSSVIPADIVFTAASLIPCAMLQTFKFLTFPITKYQAKFPNIFPSSCALKTIVFNGNPLAGPLPKNKIIGGFPCFLRKISTVCVLVLRNNKFHSPMRCIVDVAFNYKFPGIWFRNWKAMMSNVGEDQSKVEHLEFPLESLGLSNNSLEGEIPNNLASLSFLSALNLFYNHLIGKIPPGTQLQSFEASSFEGNDGLYGPPLTKTPDHGMHTLPPLAMPPCGSLACEVHWNLVSAELGSVFGLRIVIVPLLFWKKWRLQYWQFLDRILCRIFPLLCVE